MSISRPIADLVLVLAGAAAVIVGGAPFLAVMAVLVLIACGEVYRQTRLTGVSPAAAVGLAGCFALLVVAHFEGEDATLFFPIVIAGALVLAFLAMIARPDRSDVTDGLALSIVPLLVIGLFAAYAIALRSTRDGFRIVLALVLMAVVNDIVSGLVDPRRGKRALAPTIRPSRTWEGLAAGAVATLIVAVIVAVSFDQTFSFASALILGAVVSFAAPVGDLARAMLERDMRAEVTSGVMPRATVLRRIDGLLFSAPVFFYAFRLLER